jgi:exoribonuclease R
MLSFKEFINQSSAPMELTDKVSVSENLKYHLDHKIPLSENIFRIYSDSYFKLIDEVRTLYNNDKISINDDDFELVSSDICETADFNGKTVYLDCPVIDDEINEAEYKGKKVQLGKPRRTPGENKKFAVYVKAPSGNIKKVRFGDPNLKIKNNNPARAKSFRARHKCSEKKDRTKAGYWSCNIARFAKSVGLVSSRTW